MRFPLFTALLLGAAVFAAPAPRAQTLGGAARLGAVAPTLPDGFYLEDASDAAFVEPVAVAFAPGGRMFVVEKRGVVRVVVDGVLQAEPFVDLRAEVLNQHDRGLLGIAVDPDFETTRRVFLSYTVDHAATTDAARLDAFARVTSYAGRADNPTVADPASRRVLIGETFATGIPSCYFSHTIGTLAVGADGSLLVGAGDGASYNQVDAGGVYAACFGPGRLDPSENIGAFRAQRVESLAGKILRIDPETGLGLPSNPFYTGDPTDTASKVWALGVRNPFRFTLLADGDPDPEAGRPGTLYIGDVGWNVWEEVNVARGGENFGWPCYEGPGRHSGYHNATPATNGCSAPRTGTLTYGPYYWHHSDPSRSVPAGRTGRAVMVGAVYEGRKYPDAYDGALFYGDYPNGWFASARVDGGSAPTQERLFSSNAGPIVDAASDPESGYLYLVDVGAGRIWRLRHVDEAANAGPVAAATALPSQVPTGAAVQFSPEGSFDPDGDALTYAWTFGDGATSAERAPLHVYAEAGVYAASVAVSDAFSTARRSVTVTVRDGGRPTVRILSPTLDARATAGTPFPLRASVSDPDQAASTLTVEWRITQIHENHVHPDVFVGSGAEAAFSPEAHGGDGELYYYRVTASVRDATGLVSSDEMPLFLTGAGGIADVTGRGTSFAVAPNGAGLDRIADGETPPVGSGADAQFHSGAAPGRTEAGVGYAFAERLRFTGLTVQEGRQETDGGWFESVRVQVRADGTWRDVVGLTASPTYRAADGVGYDTYRFSFAPTDGDAVRLVGRPGGASAFVTVGELRAWAVEAGAETGPLPEPWASADIGSPAAAGAATFSGGAFSVTGGGDLWGAGDSAHLAWAPLAGDGVLTARVSALSPSPEWAKGALVIRAGLAAGAPYVGLAVSNLGVHVQTRAEAGAETDGPVDLYGRLAPTWLRLERSGTTVTASVSDDGQTWTAVRAVDVPALGGEAVAGLVASAADFGAGVLATAVFRDVTLTTPSVPAPWTSADVGAPAGAGGATGDGTSFDVAGGGDVWGSSDRMHLVSRPLDGDGSVVALVSTPDSPAEWAKAGIVLRAGPEAGVPYAGVVLSNLGVHLQVRAADGGPTAGPIDIWGVSGPVWLRLDRTGPEVAAFWSADGVAWEAVGTVAVPAFAAPPAVAGLVVSAADYGDGATASASFSNVTVSSVTAADPRLPALRAAPALAFGVDPVYPNPASGRATLRLYLADDGPVSIEVGDVLGRRVAAQRVEASAGVVDVGLGLEGLPAGSYVLRVEAGGEASVQRFTVVR